MRLSGKGAPQIVAIGGIDGAGKTKLTAALARAIGGLARKQRVGNESARALRSIASGALKVSAAGAALSSAYVNDFLVYARRQNYQTSQPRRPIVYDRWKTCVKAFSVRWTGDLAACETALQHVPEPICDFILDAPAEIAFSRILRRGRPDIDESVEELNRLREAYLRLAAQRPSIIVLDASEDFATVFSSALRVARRALSMLA